MNWGLMQAICEFIADNHNEFQLLNATTRQFREYIFDKEGEYLIGGKQVSSYIIKQTKLMQEYAGEVEL